MPAVSQDKRLCTSLAQASEHEWQPMHRSMRGVVKIFLEGCFLVEGCFLLGIIILQLCHRPQDRLTHRDASRVLPWCSIPLWEAHPLPRGE